MPFLDLWSRLGLNVDQCLLLQSGENSFRTPSRCHAFEKELVECSHGIGQTRAKRECQVELEDYLECLNRTKTLNRMIAIREQRAKMIKEGTYTVPPHHSGKHEDKP